MPERFQPRIVASFNQHQLVETAGWWRDNGITNFGATSFDDIVNKAFESAQFDEKGRPLDEKGRHRLRIAMAVLTKVYVGQIPTSFVGEIKVWQMTPDPDNITVRWAKSISRIIWI